MRTALLAVCAAAMAAFDQVPKGYVCYRAESPIIVDGKLDDAAWQKAPWTDYFVDIEGDKKPAPRFQTRVKMLWDDSCFYLAAELQEPHVWATITKRDDVIFHDNDFEVFMDPDGDNFEYGEFEINAFNTGWDLFLPKPYKDGGHADDAWNIEGMKTAVWVHGTLSNPADVDSGWTVELALPWAALERISHTKNSPQNGDQWHVNFSRVEWLTEIVDGRDQKIPEKPEDNWVWSPQGVIDMHRPEMWGTVQFSNKSAGADSVRSYPFADAKRELHRIYYAEKDYFKEHQKWCLNLKDLRTVQAPLEIRVELTQDGYVAYAHVAMPGRPTIRQDSHYLVLPPANK